MKRIFTLLIIATMFAISSLAYDVQIDGIYYNLNDETKTAEVTYKTYYSSGNYSGIKSIPEKVTYNSTEYSVTSIGNDAFSSCSSLTSITIPNSVTSIGDGAFSPCSSLTSIEVDADNPNYTSIGGVLYNKDVTILICCPGGKTSITIPNSVTSIGEWAFHDCSSLTSITIPNSVTSIGDRAFSACSLTSITIPNSVTSIGSFAFAGCSSLTSITIGNSVTSIGNNAFHSCSSLTSITIPNSVTEIGEGAFSYCSSLTSITIPNSVTSIGNNAFRYCESLTSIEVDANNQNYASIDGVLYNKDVTILICCPGGKTSITIPNSVTSIGVSAFEYCSSLTSITIPNSVTSIGERAFDGCSSLTSITIPNSITSIGNYAFQHCSSLTSITIPNSVTSIGHNAFRACSSLTSITIPNSVTSIGSYVFRDCSSLTSISIPNSVTSIGINAFHNCSSLTSITIPNSVTSIGYRAFDNCTSLTSITIPNSVTSIGYRAFDNCTSLTSITIGNSVTSIGDYAFSNCSGLTSINIEATIPPTIGGANTFNNVSKNIPVTVPCGSLSAYQSAEYWSEFTNFRESFPYTFSATTADATMGSVTIETAPACGVDAVIKATPNDDYRFVKWSDGNTENPRTITVAEDITLTAEFANDIIASGTCGDNLTWKLTKDGVLTISGTGEMYDYDYSNNSPWNSYKQQIKTININDGVTSIGDYAFFNCKSLTSITIPNSVTSIEYRAFYYCDALTSISIPNSVTSIGDEAFQFCPSLTSITIPNSVTSIGDFVFNSCSSLTSITIGNSVTSIGNSTFSGCSSLTSITIGNSVTSIGNFAFQGCTSLTSITIPNSVTYIEDYAFEYCSSLTSIIIGNSVTSIGNAAFYECSNITEIHISDIAKWCDIDFKLATSNPLNKNACLYINGNKITELVIPEGVNSIKNYAFYNYAQLTSITIPNSVTSIGNEAFSSCSSLTSITIPNSVTSIEGGAFSYCSSLTSITIPNSVTSIGSSAFYECSNIAEIHIYDIAKWCDIDFKANTSNPLNKNACLYVNGNKITELVIPEGVNSIKNYAFYNYAQLTSITIPNSVTSIGSAAFSYCSSLTSITIPNSVTSIGDEAFSDCTSLTSITIPNSVTSIEYRAFSWCESLTSITIPNSVTSIGIAAFSYCSSLTSITIPNSVTSIGNYAFSYCSSLDSITCLASTPPSANNLRTQYETCILFLFVPKGSLNDYQNHAEWGKFSNIQELEGEKYTITITVNDDAMGSIIGGGEYEKDSEITLTATANSGYRFVKWSDGNTNATRTITVTEDISLTAEFEPLPSKFHVSVTCNNPAMGMVLFTSGTNDTDYEKGATVSFVAITNSGYLFNGWSDGVKDVFRTIVITQDTTITALFGSNTCSLTLNTDATMGSVTGSGTYTKGTTATIIATPNAGYRFVKWSDGNTNATRSIIMNEDMTLSAIFEKIPTFNINVTANAQMGSATGGGTFETGKTTTLSAIANEGYHFVKWSDGVTTNPRNITVTENISLEAIFEALYPNWSFDDDKPSSTEHTFLGKEYYDTITIVAGKTITIEDNAIIACNDIIIKADKNGNVPEIKIEGDIIANNGITFEWEIDDSRWYFFTLPFNCKIRDVNLVTIANGPSDGVWNYYNPQDGSGDFIIRDYNQKRAAQGQGKKTGWVDCEANKMLHKGRGYIIGLFPAGSKAKVHFKSEKQIQLSKFIEHELDFGEEHSWYDYAEGDNQLYNGWNLVGVPYFETFSQGDLDATYVSIPNDDGTTYTQHTLAEALTQGLLRPFMSFFIQLAENVAPTFDPTDRSNAPMLRAKQNAEGGEIVVNILKAEDEELCDRTTIINNTSKTNDYEIGYDLQKMIGYAAKPQIYTIEECGILAFNAQDVLSSGIVRLGLYIPADGEYVIGGESWGKLSGAELYDNETGVATSLTIPQTIYFTKGTYNERFEIRVKQQTTTGVDVIDNDCDVYIENGRLVVENMPQNGNVYVYDSAGKLIHKQTTNSEVNLNLVVEGVYNITICTEDNRVFNTKVVY